MTEKSTYINIRALESTLPNTNIMFTLAANSMFTLAANSIFTLAAPLTSFNVSYIIIIQCYHISQFNDNIEYYLGIILSLLFSHD